MQLSIFISIFCTPPTFDIALIILISFACSENTNEPVVTVKDDAALVLVVETKFLQNPFTEIAFQYYKEDVLKILVDMFGVAKSKMENMSLSEIIEVYGEEWQINEMKKLAASFIKKLLS